MGAPVPFKPSTCRACGGSFESVSQHGGLCTMCHTPGTPEAPARTRKAPTEQMQAARAVIRCRTLTMPQKVVLSALVHRADTSGVCWPSIPTIAADAAASRRTVITVLHQLEDAGLISRAGKRTSSRPGKPITVWRVNTAPITRLVTHSDENGSGDGL